MSNEKEIGEIIVRPQPDGTTLYDIPMPKPDVLQELTIVVNRGKGDEVHKEQG